MILFFPPNTYSPIGNPAIRQDYIPILDRMEGAGDYVLACHEADLCSDGDVLKVLLAVRVVLS